MTKSDLNPNFSLREAIEQYKLQKKTGNISQTEDMNIIELLKNTEAEAAQIYARAFERDPWFEYFLGKNHSHYGATLWFCSKIVRYSIQYGRVWGKVDNKDSIKKVLGLAVWLPPNEQDISIYKMLQQGFYEAPFKFGMIASVKVLQSLNITTKVHNEIISEPHWYLFCIGVDPPFQNNGIGTKIMYPVLQLADKSGISCYLDTASKRSLTFFTRLGFEVVREIPAEGDSPQWWAMLRKPVPASNIINQNQKKNI